MKVETWNHFGAAADSQDVVEDDVNRGDADAMGEVVVDGEIESENEENDAEEVEKRAEPAATVETIQAHRDEGDAGEGPGVDDGHGAEKKAEEVVVEAHPEAVGGEDEDHGERGVDETGARDEHSGGEEEEEVEERGGGVAEESSNTRYEQSFPERTEERQKAADRVEHRRFISTENPVHHFGKTGKGNNNRVGAQTVLRAAQFTE